MSLDAKIPPRSATARGLRLGRAVVQAGAGVMLERLGATGRGQIGAAAGSLAAHSLTQALLELRGAAVKVAQFLSLESDLLTPALAAQLARASHRVPPIGPELARHLTRAALGPIDRHFSTFDERPFAAASLGQVHAATTLDGRAVAVKIQYPGMTDTVRSDLRVLRHASGLLPQRAHYRRVLDEVEKRLIEECDYLQEAQAQSWFRARLQIEGATVAEVFPALSARRVITSARLGGLHLDAWLQTRPGQALRDRAAQCVYDVFVRSLHGLGRLHGDPNPGNILFQDDGSVALLDFGCTRWIAADVQDMVARIWRSAIRADADAAVAVYREMGLFAHLSDEQARQLDCNSLRPFREWLAVPFNCERFDFGAQPGFVAAGRGLFVHLWRDEALAGIRPEFVLINRTLYGLYRLFERLGARVRIHTAWTAG